MVTDGRSFVEPEGANFAADARRVKTEPQRTPVLAARRAGAGEMVVRGQERARSNRLVWMGTVLLLGGLVCVAGVVPPPEAGAQKASREDVQAAYLYNFGKFVRWPENAGRGPIEVCVAGDDPFGQTLGRLVAGEQTNGRSFEVRNLDRPEGAGECAILFVGRGDKAREDAFLGAVAGKPILTVGDAPDFLTRGGMIQFLMVEDHVRFSVNLEAATRCGVGLSSQLLKVAVAVTGKPETGGAR